jgi:hypothetical protein
MKFILLATAKPVIIPIQPGTDREPSVDALQMVLTDLRIGRSAAMSAHRPPRPVKAIFA